MSAVQHTYINSAMGLQATAATKRKHEITFDGKQANTYTNSPPPLKTGKWSINNNNYIEAIEEQQQQLNGISIKDATASMRTLTNGSSDALKDTTVINNNANGNISGNGSNSSNTGILNSISNGKEVTKTADSNTPHPVVPSATGFTTSSSTSLPSVVASLLPMAREITATTPLPPTSTTPVPEDSIAKLEEVAAVPCCEPWTNSATEPVDCISKLQAVAVPSDPWGSIATRSTLATTLLSADELDDDDDDFEDDYEEEESIIPTYCPLRYHSFPPPPPTPTSPHQQQRLGSYAPAPLGYGSRPNYYSEPYPQQNCSRTGSLQHMRMPGGNGFTQWQSAVGGLASGGQQFYVAPEAAYPPPQQQPPQPPQQQQTIRCAENGKSYLELGCSSPVSNVNSVNTASVVPPPPFGNLHVAAANLDARHPLKRCCDGRGAWCNTNKNCYKDLRLKIRNLSMFKLSRFRQVSEQSLYRSVLICNTLKRIDREIETEAKEMHQAAAQAAAAQQHHYHQHLHPPHHLQHHLGPQQPPQQLLVPQQPHTMLHQQHQDYAPPVMNCARLSNMDYQVQHQPPSLLQQQPTQHFSQHVPQYQNQPERLDTPPPYLSVQPQQLQKLGGGFALSNSLTSINMNNCDSPTLSATSPPATLHPYDHYPFRESQSGRATPFPCQPAMSPAPPSPTPTQTAAQTQQSVVAETLIAPSTENAPTNNVVSTATATNVSSNVLTTPLTTTTTSVVSTTDSSDSGYADDDSTRSINWSSVLSLSSQSALDPLNSNDLFAILPPALSITNPATATPVPVTAATSVSVADITAQPPAVTISGSFTTVQSTTASSTSASASAPSNSNNIAAFNTCTSSSTATFTTLSTISSATHSLTSSYVSSMSANAAAASASSTWEYGFLDMEFGLGSEFTELVPSCKLSSDELFKSSLTPVVAASRYSSMHDNELEQPAHIMVGS
ncbi:PREDICTED: uncharacterized protein LOC108363244 isoform X2 [Rhagoletis zephyria]|uniref:uncharacterized protein LOC108363244 isoform X2 n=1 Tax=Rhagoletis zephyria TaxID=28612 RepID=UPI0008114218|nr:PREDICTED: uncharacterized protein LOC108363244 isoform X2 [Rhagoletis zephyria]